MNPADYVVPIIIALLGGGGIWALFKIRPEAGMVVVQAAEQVVIMQRGTIVDLTAQIDQCNKRADAAERKADDACASVERMTGEMRELREELLDTRQERDEFKSEATRLQARVLVLEARVQELERHQSPFAEGDS